MAFTPPAGSSGQLQYNLNGVVQGCYGVTWDGTNYQIVLTGKSGQSVDILQANRYDGQKQFYVDSSGNSHIGAKDQYTSGSFTYRDSYRHYFDYYFNGSQQDCYIQAIPNSAGGQQQAKLQFFVSGTNEMEISGVDGLVAPGGARLGSFLISGSTLRTISTSGIFQGQNSYLQLQGEQNIAGQYDLRFVGKAGSGGSTASSIAGFYNDTIIVTVITKEGYITLAQGSLRILGRTSTTADPTTTELPNDKDLAIHKNTTTGFIYLAYNDGGTIKKATLT